MIVCDFFTLISDFLMNSTNPTFPIIVFYPKDDQSIIAYIYRTILLSLVIFLSENPKIRFRYKTTHHIFERKKHWQMINVSHEEPF